mmetsp:Transcript_8001/g.18735  ORF Transcript_8001/g.18735 Transcript_8001/m.18735 type:complete len:246 (-) Transcript_8001:1070-1807(-)
MSQVHPPSSNHIAPAPAPSPPRCDATPAANRARPALEESRAFATGTHSEPPHALRGAVRWRFRRSRRCGWAGTTLPLGERAELLEQRKLLGARRGGRRRGSVGRGVRALLGPLPSRRLIDCARRLHRSERRCRPLFLLEHRQAQRLRLLPLLAPVLGLRLSRVRQGGRFLEPAGLKRRARLLPLQCRVPHRALRRHVERIDCRRPARPRSLPLGCEPRRYALGARLDVLVLIMRRGGSEREGRRG